MPTTNAGAQLQDIFIQIILYDSVLHALHRDSQEVCIGGIGVMNIDLTVHRTVEAFKLLGKVLLSSLDVRIGTLIIGEVVPDRLVSKLFLEKVRLIKKEDDGRLAEPRQTEDRLEEHQRLLHLVLRNKSQQNVGLRC